MPKTSKSKLTLAQIKEAMTQFIPYLKSHTGGLEVVSWNSKTGTVEIKLQGACYSCILASITLKEVIEANLRQKYPEVKKVITIN